MLAIGIPVRVTESRKLKGLELKLKWLVAGREFHYSHPVWASIWMFFNHPWLASTSDSARRDYKPVLFRSYRNLRRMEGLIIVPGYSVQFRKHSSSLLSGKLLME